MTQQMTAYNVNHDTGETDRPFTDESSKELVIVSSKFMSVVMDGITPAHIQVLLDKYPNDGDKAEYEYSQFTGTTAISLKEQFERSGPFEANVLGVMILPHAPFKGMNDDEDDPLREGYWTIYIMTDKKDQDTQQNTVYYSGSKSLREHMKLAIASKSTAETPFAGFGIWPRPIHYRFSAGKKGVHQMRRTDNPPTTVRVKEAK